MVTVEVEWQGPWRFTREELVTTDVPPYLADSPFNETTKLYAIYGTHVVFGRNALLYIGRTDERLLRTRLSEHWRGWLNAAQEPSIHVGTIQKVRENNRDSRSTAAAVLASVEALTIWWHSPPYNSKHIQSWQLNPEQFPDLELQNYGQIGSLVWEFSTYWGKRRGARPGDEEG